MIDLKDAAAKAVVLQETLRDVQGAIVAKTLVEDGIIQKIQSLSSVQDCVKLLAESKELSAADEKAKKDLEEALEAFKAVAPDSAAYVAFNDFMKQQFVEGQDNCDMSKGQVSFLLSMHEPQGLFQSIGEACYAGLSWVVRPFSFDWSETVLFEESTYSSPSTFPDTKNVNQY